MHDTVTMKTSSLTRLILRYKGGFAALLILLVYVIIAVGGARLAPYDPREMHYSDVLTPPTLKYPFGTDECGRDIFSMIISSTATTLLVAIGSVGLALVIGVPMGLIAAYEGKALDSLIMRLCDALMAFPPIIVAMVFVVVLGGQMITVILSIALATIPRMARMTRSAALKEKGEDYVKAAEAVGATRAYIVFRSLLPNCFPTIIVYATLYAALNIKIEAALSFLGLGLQPPAISWGYILRSGYFHISRAPWYVTFPGLNIFIVVLCLNLLGDALRDKLDPRLKGVE